MNKKIIFVAGLFLSLAMVACDKEGDSNVGGIPEDAVMLTTEGYTGQNGEKTSVSGNSVQWVGEGEVVRLNSYTPNVEVSGDNAFVRDVTLSGAVYGYYPSTIVAADGWETTTPTVTIPSSYTCTMSGDRQVIALPMVAYSSTAGDEIEFKHLTAAVNVMVWNATDADLYVDRVVVTVAGHRLHGDIALNFTNANYGVADTYNDPASDADSTVSVTFPASGEGSLVIAPGEGNVKSIQVPILPVNNDHDISIQIYTHVSGAAWHKYIFNHHASMPNALTRNKMLTARCKIHTSDGNHVIENKITINANGDKVFFSPGNLQYQASTNTWRFAEHQYDCVGTDNQYIASGYTGWIDLFGWGTSGHVFASGYGSAYQPWSTSTTSTDYGPNGNYALTGTYANGDWGVENDIGTSAAGTWHTASFAEWYYLVNTRSSTTINGTENARYTHATINTDVTPVNGLILFPDNYIAGTPAGVTWGSINAASEWGTKCTSAGWASLEAAGCVFLPTAGCRNNGTEVSSIGSFGDYWYNTSANENNARFLRFYSNYVNASMSNTRRRGLSVRLVKNAN